MEGKKFCASSGRSEAADGSVAQDGAHREAKRAQEGLPDALLQPHLLAAVRGAGPGLL